MAEGIDPHIVEIIGYWATTDILVISAFPVPPSKFEGRKSDF